MIGGMSREQHRSVAIKLRVAELLIRSARDEALRFYAPSKDPLRRLDRFVKQCGWKPLFRIRNDFDYAYSPHYQPLKESPYFCDDDQAETVASFTLSMIHDISSCNDD
jgi:hypothetical protein